MDKVFYTLILAVIFNFGYSQTKIVRNLNSYKFQKEISSNKITLIDVRTHSEYASGHLKDAAQLNYYALDFKKKLLLLSKNEPIYLYCNTGYRSKKAAAFLVDKGYTQVINLELGIMEWNHYDLPVIIDPNSNPDQANKMGPDEYHAFIETNYLVFVGFYAPWCAPCQKMMPMIDSLEVEYKDQIKIIKVNADASKKLIKELNLITVPYLVLYKNGKPVFNHKGMIEESILEDTFNRHL